MRKHGPVLLMLDDHTVLPELPAGDPAGVFPLAARRCEVGLH